VLNEYSRRSKLKEKDKGKEELEGRVDRSSTLQSLNYSSGVRFQSDQTVAPTAAEPGGLMSPSQVGLMSQDANDSFVGRNPESEVDAERQQEVEEKNEDAAY